MLRRTIDKFGLRPIELAGWRRYSAIGLGEMAQFRDRLLAEPRANQKKIEAEYKGATARYAAATRAAAEWDRKAGIAPLRAKFKRACEAEKRASNRMIRTPVTTPAGAAALIEHVRRDMELGDASWHKVALANVAKALASMSGGAHEKAPSQAVSRDCRTNVGRLLRDMTRNLEIAEAIRAVATPRSDTRAFRRVTD